MNNNGYGIIKNKFIKDEVKKLKKILEDLIIVITKKYTKKEITIKDNENRFHSTIIDLAYKKPDLITYFINTFMQTADFQSFLCSKKIQKLINKNVFKNNEDIPLIINELNFRIDLPSCFKKEKKLYSLDWHQESGYFKNYVSHKNGIVLWIPLFDVTKTRGAIRLLKHSHLSGSVKHEEEFMDIEKQKNFRVKVPEKIIKEMQLNETVLEASAGDIVYFHFNTIHAGGNNVDPDYVRLTLQARVSSFYNPDFIFTNQF